MYTSLTGLLTHVAAPARGALARSSCRVALASVLALALQHAARPEPVVLAAWKNELREIMSCG